MLNLKKGDSVILKGFTGIKLGVFEVKKADKKTVTVEKKDGTEMVFDRKTGKQINVAEGKERYANSIMEDDGSFVAPSTAGAKRKKSKKAEAKKSKKVEEPDDDEDDEEEDEEVEEPKKGKTSKTSKKSKKSKKPEPEEEEDEEDDEDEYEEDDEDED